MTATQNWQPLGRDALAARLAQDIPEGWSVNLGIGIPTLVGNYVPPEREVVFHSENGILGMGPAPAPDQINRWLINASSQYVTLRPGGSYMSHSDSFALVRGGHNTLDVRGERVDAAVGLAEKFLDDALRSGSEAVFVIHGHGTGALCESLRRELAVFLGVTEVRLATSEEGGDGVTVIVLG